MTAWSPFSESTKDFEPSTKEWILNYRADNSDALLEVLKTEGVRVAGELESYESGKFGWILDPEGNKIELWEPVDDPLLKQKPKRQ